jgi:hypothetical protein
MCIACIESLQARMDEAALKHPPERLLVHLDDFESVNMPVGSLLTHRQVESGLHDSMSENCWCRPIVITPSDDRAAAEILADYVSHDMREVVT